MPPHENFGSLESPYQARPTGTTLNPRRRPSAALPPRLLAPAAVPSPPRQLIASLSVSVPASSSLPPRLPPGTFPRYHLPDLAHSKVSPSPALDCCSAPGRQGELASKLGQARGFQPPEASPGCAGCLRQRAFFPSGPYCPLYMFPSCPPFFCHVGVVLESCFGAGLVVAEVVTELDVVSSFSEIVLDTFVLDDFEK